MRLSARPSPGRIPQPARPTNKGTQQMRDYLDLSPTPIDEPCAMVEKTGDYMPRMRAECRAFVSQLERTFPQALAAGVTFRIKSIHPYFASSF